MKKLICVLLAMSLVCASLTACGSASEELQEELDGLQAEYDSLKDKYDALNDDHNTLQDEYAQLQGDYAALQDDYDAAMAERESGADESESTPLDFGDLTTAEFIDISFSYGEDLHYEEDGDEYVYIYFSDTSFVMFMYSDMPAADLNIVSATAGFDGAGLEYSDIEETEIDGQAAYGVFDGRLVNDDVIGDYFMAMVMFPANDNVYAAAFVAPIQMYEYYFDHYLEILDSVGQVQLSDESDVDLDTTASAEAASVTTGQRNALSKANQYLSIMAFSYSGLIEQLEYEGFSHEEAAYGADNCGADWNEQAAKKAASYLDLMAFSRSGLISQLEFDGFTHEQAVYGAEQNGY